MSSLDYQQEEEEETDSPLIKEDERTYLESFEIDDQRKAKTYILYLLSGHSLLSLFLRHSKYPKRRRFIHFLFVVFVSITLNFLTEELKREDINRCNRSSTCLNGCEESQFNCTALTVPAYKHNSDDYEFFFFPQPLDGKGRYTWKECFEKYTLADGRCLSDISTEDNYVCFKSCHTRETTQPYQCMNSDLPVCEGGEVDGLYCIDPESAMCDDDIAFSIMNFILGIFASFLGFIAKFAIVKIPNLPAYKKYKVIRYFIYFVMIAMLLFVLMIFVTPFAVNDSGTSIDLLKKSCTSYLTALVTEAIQLLLIFHLFHDTKPDRSCPCCFRGILHFKCCHSHPTDELRTSSTASMKTLPQLPHITQTPAQNQTPPNRFAKGSTIPLQPQQI